MKRKSTFMVLVLSAVLFFSDAVPAGATNEGLNCLLGFLTKDTELRTFCQYTLPPGNCVICYMDIEVKVQQ